jgi:hypothetical protein
MTRREALAYLVRPWAVRIPLLAVGVAMVALYIIGFGDVERYWPPMVVTPLVLAGFAWFMWWLSGQEFLR